MRAKIIHVTDHAVMRWRERVSCSSFEEIIHAVKSSKVLKKKELLPYPIKRQTGSVYAVNEHVLFVLECISIDEYRLVTVIA